MSWILSSIFGEQGEGDVPDSENSNDSTLSKDDVRARRLRKFEAVTSKKEKKKEEEEKIPPRPPQLRERSSETTKIIPQVRGLQLSQEEKKEAPAKKKPKKSPSRKRRDHKRKEIERHNLLARILEISSSDNEETLTVDNVSAVIFTRLRSSATTASNRSLLRYLCSCWVRVPLPSFDTPCHNKQTEYNTHRATPRSNEKVITMT